MRWEYEVMKGTENTMNLVLRPRYTLVNIVSQMTRLSLLQ